MCSKDRENTAKMLRLEVLQNDLSLYHTPPASSELSHMLPEDNIFYIRTA